MALRKKVIFSVGMWHSWPECHKAEESSERSKKSAKEDANRARARDQTRVINDASQ